MCINHGLEAVALHKFLVHVFESPTEAGQVQKDGMAVQHLGPVPPPRSGVEGALAGQLLAALKEGELHSHHLLTFELEVLDRFKSRHCHQVSTKIQDKLYNVVPPSCKLVYKSH